MRNKIEKLLGGSDRQDASEGQSEALYNVTEKSLWKVLLTNISFTKRPDRRRVPSATGGGLDERLQDGIFVQGPGKGDGRLSELPGTNLSVDASQAASREDDASILRTSPPSDPVPLRYPSNDNQRALTNTPLPDDIFVDEPEQTWWLPRTQKTPDLLLQSPLPPRMSSPYVGTESLPGIYVDPQGGAENLDSCQDIPGLDTDDGIFVFYEDAHNSAGVFDADLVEQVDNHGAHNSGYSNETKPDEWPREIYWENAEAQLPAEPRQLPAMALPGLFELDSCGF